MGRENSRVEAIDSSLCERAGLNIERPLQFDGSDHVLRESLMRTQVRCVLSGGKVKREIKLGVSRYALSLTRVVQLMACAATIVGFASVAASQTSSGIVLRSITAASTDLGGGSSLTLGQPSGMAAGDVLIAQLAVRGGTDLTLTAPPEWMLIRRDDYNGSIAQAVYSKAIFNPSTEPTQYTWYFDSGNDAEAGIADYAGVGSIVANSGQGVASSNYVVAPSVQIPDGSAAVTVSGFFAIASSGPVVPPAKMSQHWSFRATGWGIGVGMGDLTMAPGQPTGNQIGTVSQAASNAGALVVLSGVSSPTPTPTATSTPSPSPTLTLTGITYYISPTGSDSNNGTSQISTWATIQHAANVMQPGDTAIVLAGNYNQRVRVSRSGQNGKPITFQALAGATVTMQGFQVNASYIHIVGFDITNHNQTDLTAWGIYLIGSNNTVSGNNIHDLCAQGIYVSGNGNPNSTGTANNIISHNSFIRDEMAGGADRGAEQSRCLQHCQRHLAVPAELLHAKRRRRRWVSLLRQRARLPKQSDREYTGSRQPI